MLGVVIMVIWVDGKSLRDRLRDERHLTDSISYIDERRASPGVVVCRGSGLR